MELELGRVDVHEPFLPVTAPVSRVPSPLASGSMSGSGPGGQPKRASRLPRGITPVRLVLALVVLLVLGVWVSSGSPTRPTPTSKHPSPPASADLRADPLEAVRERPPLHVDALRTTACDGTDAVRYGLVIDAGSQGSRIHVYKFNTCAARHGAARALPELEDELFVAKKGGLSKYAGQPSEAAASLKELLDAALNRVPDILHRCTPIVVKATAGLRLTGEREAADILEAVRTMLLTQYPFPLADTPGHNAVEIMNGSEEAVYAWITVNYLLGRIGGKHSSLPTAAVLDLGGASTQIVFEPDSTDPLRTMRPGAHVYELSNLAGNTRVLYQNSYLGYGLMQVREAVHALSAFLHGLAQARNRHRPWAGGVVPHPCLLRNESKSVNVTLLPPAAAAAAGYAIPPAVAEAKRAHLFQGTADDPQACAAVVEAVLDKHAPCAEQPCAFAGVYQPSLKASLPAGAPVVALSYFYDRLAPLGLGPSFEIDELAKLVSWVCQGPSGWPSYFGRTPGAITELKNRPESCLDLTYLLTLLRNGYELDNMHTIVTEKKIAGTELGWALGAQLAVFEHSSIQCHL